jgi:hypothetical protein
MSRHEPTWCWNATIGAFYWLTAAPGASALPIAVLGTDEEPMIALIMRGSSSDNARGKPGLCGNKTTDYAAGDKTNGVIDDVGH